MQQLIITNNNLMETKTYKFTAFIEESVPSLNRNIRTYAGFDSAPDALTWIAGRDFSAIVNFGFYESKDRANG